MNGGIRINRERTACELDLSTDGLRTEGKAWRVIKKLAIRTKVDGRGMKIFTCVHETVKNYISLYKLKSPVGQIARVSDTAQNFHFIL